MEIKKYEIETRTNHWIEVSKYIFDSWTGSRMIDGIIYQGIVYSLGENVKQKDMNWQKITIQNSRNG